MMSIKSLNEIFNTDNTCIFFKQVIEGKAEMNQEQRDVAIQLTAAAAASCFNAIKHSADSSLESMLALVALAAGVTEPEASDADIAKALLKITAAAVHFGGIPTNE